MDCKISRCENGLQQSATAAREALKAAVRQLLVSLVTVNDFSKHGGVRSKTQKTAKDAERRRKTAKYGE